MEEQVLEAMSEEQILEAAGACADTVRQAEIDLLRLAYQWAVVHDPERLDPAEAARPGRERARRLGGEGVAEVCEFAAAEFGARIGRTTYAAARLIGDAQDLHHRHRQLWGRVQAGEVRASYARHVTARTRDLSRAEAAFVDAEVAESADGRIPWSRFEALVEATVVQAAPEAARREEERAAKARFAKTLRGQAHGMASFLIRADVATITTLEAAITGYAARLREAVPGATDDERRVLAVLLLVCGHPHRTSDPDPSDPDPSPASVPVPEMADLLPEVVLYVHTYADPEYHGIARVEGHGPVDAYEIPHRHRQAVHLMTPADIFPYASGLDRLDHRGSTMQVDHTMPFDQGGVSRVGNYGPMTTTHHRPAITPRGPPHPGPPRARRLTPVRRRGRNAAADTSGGAAG